MGRSAIVGTGLTVMSFRGCPRCKGAVLEFPASHDEGAMCVNCGWRRHSIPPEVQEYVDEHLGKPYLRQRYQRARIATGKPPLSGWDRLKRRRTTKKQKSA